MIPAGAQDVLVRTAAAEGRPSKRRWRVWGAHSSGRFDRPAKAWRRSLARLRRRASWVTGTEAAGRNAALFRAVLDQVGWDYAHLAGAARGECYATWDGAAFELAGHPFARQITDKTWTRSPEYGGGVAAYVHALVVPLVNRVGRRLVRVLVVVHMPLDNTDPRQAAWLDCCLGLAELQRDLERMFPGAEIVFVMDGNKNLRESDEFRQVVQHLERPLGVMVSWHHPFPPAGTDGKQLIDYALAAPGVIVDCELLEDDDSSDHRPFRYRMRGWLRRLFG